MNPNNTDPNNSNPSNPPDLSSVLQAPPPVLPDEPTSANSHPVQDQTPMATFTPPPANDLPLVSSQTPTFTPPAADPSPWLSTSDNPASDSPSTPDQLSTNPPAQDPNQPQGFNWSPAPASAAEETTTPASPVPLTDSPAQPEPLMPTFTPPDTQTGSSAYNPEPQVTPDFSTVSSPEGPLSTETPPPQSEVAPTDLSQLAAQEPQVLPVFTPPVTQAETLVSSTTTGNNGNADVPNIPVEGGGGGMPKWVIGIAIGLIIVVAGASAYFILGIGKNTPETESLPATTQTQQTLVEPPKPVTQVQSSPTTASSGFDQFGSTTGAPSATSAADLLKARQGR